MGSKTPFPVDTLVEMTAAELIAKEISRHRAIPFERFMDLALYAPECGYYTSARDPFGAHGDFFTAEQVQPVFGMLMGRLVRGLCERAGARTVVELGAGRGEMRSGFDGLDYIPIDSGRGTLPEHFSGVVFANEFFDALPVHVVKRGGKAFREMFVGSDGERFVFRRTRRPLDARIAAYVNRYHAAAPPASMIEVNLHAYRWVEKITKSLARGSFVIIDYGYTTAEWKRFEQGTLMSYRRHVASEDVLAGAGERDITAHVAWTPLQDALVENGWRIETFETLVSAILRIGEPDQFEALFMGLSEQEQLKRRMQLKTLLFGMGETFRVLVASRG